MGIHETDQYTHDGRPAMKEKEKKVRQKQRAYLKK